jgi:predicted nucleotidyltransferase
LPDLPTGPGQSENVPIMGTEIQVTELLFGRYRRQVLALLLLRPDESFYVRELERLSGMRAGPLHRELSALAAAGLVRRLSRGNQVRYQANRSAPFFTELSGIFRKAGESLGAAQHEALTTREPEAQYRAPQEQRIDAVPGLKRLGATKRDITAICRKWGIARMSLFGSVTRGDFGAGSDVDVLVEFPRGGAPSLFGVVRLRDELSALCGGRPVDVVTPAALRNPARRSAIEKDLQVIYEAD